MIPKSKPMVPEVASSAVATNDGTANCKNSNKASGRLMAKGRLVDSSDSGLTYRHTGAKEVKIGFGEKIKRGERTATTGEEREKTQKERKEKK